MIYKRFDCAVKEISDDGLVTYALTTEDLDRDGEICDADGADWTDYAGNPIWMWGHKHQGKAGMTIGNGSNWRVFSEGEKRGILIDVRYDIEEGPASQAAIVAGKVKRKVLRAVSIGFIPLEWLTPNSPRDKIAAVKNERIRALLLSGQCTCYYTRYKVLEGSNVHIPANQVALRVAGLGLGGHTCHTIIEYLEKELSMSNGVSKVAALPPADALLPAAEEVMELRTARIKDWSEDSFGLKAPGNFDPRVADISARLHTQAKALPMSLDPRGEGTVDQAKALQHHSVLKCIMRDYQDLLPDDGDGPEVDDDDGDMSEDDMSLKGKRGAVKTVKALTFGDLNSLVEAAVSATLPKDADNESTWVWILDMTADWAVYQAGGGEMCQVPYTVDDSNQVTLGEAIPVARQTSYVPLATAGADAAKAFGRRSKRSAVVASETGFRIVGVKAGAAISADNAGGLKDSLGHLEEGVRKCVKGMAACASVLKGAGIDYKMPTDFPGAELADTDANDPVLNAAADPTTKAADASEPATEPPAATEPSETELALEALFG